MTFFIFKILPLLTLAALVVGVIFTVRSITRGGKAQRIIGTACIALFVVLLVALVLLGLAQM